MTDAEDKVVALSEVRAKREAKKLYRSGYCGKKLSEPCGMKNPAHCWMHAYSLPESEIP